ncbi:adenylate kinase 8-like [Bacillus rossius redtenbacheri]|uniref:adenylate kinase 8-like n=1 Tax=Bacillus rossius redtenbacheri TaxID=93214 RepID=UPI002FDF0496
MLSSMELATDLVVQRPEDHVKFLKKALVRLQHYRDRPRLLILAPPHIDMENIAECVYEVTGALPVTRADIIALSTEIEEEEEEVMQNNEGEQMKIDEEEQMLKELMLQNEQEKILQEKERRLQNRFCRFLLGRSLQNSEEQLFENKDEEEVLQNKEGEEALQNNEQEQNSQNNEQEQMIHQTDEEQMLQNKEEEPMKAEIFARRAYEVLNSNPFLEKGWILVDFPDTYEEAIMLQRAGVHPTQVMQLIPSVLNKTGNLTSEAAMRQSRSKIYNGIKNYRRHILPLREAYKHVIKEVDVSGMDMRQVCEHVALQVRLSAAASAPFVPRLALLGFRGSGRRSLARMLAQRFGVVHVDLDEVMRQLFQAKPELKDQIKAGKKTNNNVINAIIEEKLLSWECLSRGWVLTGFPRTLEEFKMLDLTDTPPNRVALLDISPEEALKYTSGIRYNVYTGSRHNLLYDTPEVYLEEELDIHPDDMPRVVKEEIATLHEQLDALVEYCGASLTVVDALQPERRLFETLSAVLTRPAPVAPPRRPLG